MSRTELQHTGVQVYPGRNSSFMTGGPSSPTSNGFVGQTVAGWTSPGGSGSRSLPQAQPILLSSVVPRPSSLAGRRASPALGMAQQPAPMFGTSTGSTSGQASPPVLPRSQSPLSTFGLGSQLDPAPGTPQANVLLSPQRHCRASLRPQSPSQTWAARPQLASVAPTQPFVKPDFLEEGEKVEAWLAPDAQKARCRRLGLDRPGVAAFVEAREFVSLGCFCGIARALQAVGVKRLAYPFDWVRAPVEGVIHCIDSSFEDFLTFAAVTQPASVKQPVYVSTRWGGSFWHHDPSSASTCGDFTRRAERLLGLRDIPPDHPRVFVRAVNTTRELGQEQRLLAALRRQLPEAEVRLLVLVDLMAVAGPLRLATCSTDEVLYYFVHEDVFGGTPQAPGSAWSMEKHAEAYAEAVAFACRYWAGEEGGLESIPVADDIEALTASITQWDGGCPANEMFFPRPYQGCKVTIGKSFQGFDGSPVKQRPRAGPLGEEKIDFAKPGTIAANPEGAQAPTSDLAAAAAGGPDAAAGATPPRRLSGGPGGMQAPASQSLAETVQAQDQRFHRLASDELASAPFYFPESEAPPLPAALVYGEGAERVEVFDIPSDISPGGFLEAMAFGSLVRIVIPDGGMPGQKLRLMKTGGGAMVCEKVSAL